VRERIDTAARSQAIVIGLLTVAVTIAVTAAALASLRPVLDRPEPLTAPIRWDRPVAFAAGLRSSAAGTAPLR
jgi:hypothetical protein